ncbi:hypothetical protein HC761_02415 [bacterium]|nr:hypothetical protein [bacterium]
MAAQLARCAAGFELLPELGIDPGAAGEISAHFSSAEAFGLIESLLRQWQQHSEYLPKAMVVSYAVLLAELELLLDQSDLAKLRLAPELASGGVVCCGMVPMRNLPFRIVCVLGLNADEFPRAAITDSSDWMKKQGMARLGDRNALAEDQYLLLEAMIAAQDKLFLSYVATQSDSKSQSQPSNALVAVIQQLKAMCDQDDEASWLQRIDHELAFNRLALRRTEIAATRLDVSSGLWPDAPDASDAPSALSSQTISLNALLEFWRHPPRYFFRRHLPARIPFATEEESDLAVRASGLRGLERMLMRMRAARAGKTSQAGCCKAARSRPMCSGSLSFKTQCSALNPAGMRFAKP